MTYLKLAPYAAILLLVIAVMFMRGEKLKAESLKDRAVAEANALREVNKQNADTIKGMADNQATNDQIVKDLAADVAAIRERGVTTRTIIEKAAANDPIIKTWTEEPVPAAVRDALRRTDSVRNPSETSH